MKKIDEPIACKLPLKDGVIQAMEWRDLNSHVLRSETVDNGMAMYFDAELIDQVEDLVARESQCCGFLSMDIRQHGTELRLEITSENPDAAPVIAMLAGAQAP